MLTNNTIAMALPGDTLLDDNCPGLHLRCFPKRKSFYLRFRTKTGQQRRPKIGDYPVIGIDQARQIAKNLIVSAMLGNDPMLERQAARGAPTVADLTERYLREYAAKKKPRSYAEDSRQIAAYIAPKLGKMRVQAVEYEDISSVHQDLKSTPYQANRVLALLSTMFTLAEKWRLRPPHSNPCRHVNRYTERKRQRYMQSDEGPKIEAWLASQKVAYPQFVAFVYLLMFSGARPEEIARARREWVKPLNIGGVLELPDSKTGARPVYLPPQVMELIACLPQNYDTLTGIQSPKRFWYRLRREVGCRDLRLYDLRHTFASAALKAGYSLDQIGELLGHRNTQTTKRYAHLISESAQQATAATAGILEQMMKPKASTSLSSASDSSSSLPVTLYD